MVRCDICERIVVDERGLQACCECDRNCCKMCISREYWNFDPIDGHVYWEYVCEVCYTGHIPVNLEIFQN
jgi:hypothetical protein